VAVGETGRHAGLGGVLNKGAGLPMAWHACQGGGSAGRGGHSLLPCGLRRTQMGFGGPAGWTDRDAGRAFGLDPEAEV
jgi:hypothetical protein